MKRLRVVLALALIVGVVSIPSTAHAQACSSIEGRAFLDFGTTGQGKAQLYVDGVPQVVPFVPTGVIETGENTLDIRFVFFFDQGSVVIIEHSVGTPLGDGLVSFDSDLEIRRGASGGLHWYGIADQNAGFAHIQSVTGEICFGR